MFLKRTTELWHQIGLRYRLAGSYTFIFGATLIIFSMLVFREFVQTHQREFDAALYNHAVDVAEAVNTAPFGDLALNTDIVSEGDKLFPFSIGQSFLEIRNYDGEIIGRSQSLGDAELPFSEQVDAKLGHRSAMFQTVDLKGLPGVGERNSMYRMITFVVQRPKGESLYLQIAVPRIFLERERKGLITVFAIAIPAILLIALLTGLLLSHRALRPVHQISEIAKAISAQSLTERVPVPRPHDELRELAQTFNELLDRLKRSFDSQERFIADASHQLKTPLSILRGELDVLMSRERSPNELREFLGSASQEINQLIQLTEDLLILARVDAGQQSLHMSEVHLEEILVETTARLEKLAQPKQIKLNLQLGDAADAAANHIPAMMTYGDPELLACMIGNLIENAIKYSPPQKTVFIRAAEITGGLLQIEVSDQGTGIDPERLPHIFERFYRGHKIRVQGSGLGLAIAQQIAHVHQGRILVRSEVEKGSYFTIEIKKV